MLYFDHAAATPLAEGVKSKLIEAFENDFANASSAHRLGREQLQKVEKARFFFTDVLKATDFDFIFTASATESNNSAIKALSISSSAKIFYSPADHPSLVQPVERLFGERAFEIPLLANGEIDYLKLSNLVDSTVELLAISQVNNHSGARQDIDRVGAILKSKAPKAHLHVDGVQAFGKLPFNLNKSHVDSYSISGHKIAGPKGVAGLYWRKGKPFQPLLEGGGQEMGFRSSTLATPLILAFHHAAQLSLENIEDKFALVQNFSNRVREGLTAGIPSIVFPFATPASPYILTCIIPGLPSDIMMRQLERLGVFVSSNSACSSKISGHSSVYQALGIQEAWHKFVLRFSFSAMQKEEDIDAFISQFVLAYNGISHLIKG